jgi:general secretion pathway protein G
MSPPAGRPSPEAGFSLVEILVVVAIMALLATTVALAVLPRLDDSRVGKAQTDIKLFEQALEMYKLDTFSYPRTQDGLQALVSPPAGLSRPDRYREGGYIRKLELDPWGNPYQYAYPGARAQVEVFSLGADGLPGGEGLDADIGNWQ